MKSFAKGYLDGKGFKPFNSAATSAQNQSSEQPSHLYMAFQLLKGTLRLFLDCGLPRNVPLSSYIDYCL